MKTDSPLCQEEIFSQVFRDYSEKLHNYIYYKSGDSELAQDITQEAFITLWNHCEDAKLETAQGYVFTIAKNKLLNSYQHDKVKLKFKNQKHKDHSTIDPEHILLEKEFHDTLEKAISNLPEKQREVFLMSRIDKMTYKDIAQTIGISKQAVEKRIYNALNTLRKLNFNIK